MKIARGIKFMLDSRGFKKGFKRLGFILSRFGLSPRRQIDGLGLYASILARHGARGTFFIPAIILNKYSKALRDLKIPNIDWGIHGDLHTDLSRLSLEMQKQQIENAVRIFRQLNYSFMGFRAPYLKTNAATFQALEESACFVFDSSVPVVWKNTFQASEQTRTFMREFYNPQNSSAFTVLPYRKGRLLEIPVTLPDDDILVDREARTEKEIAAIWLRILQESHARGELFVLQLHPERIQELKNALDDLLKAARKLQPPVWVAGLFEIADWERGRAGSERWPENYRSAFSVTGDIDSLSLWDFAERVRKW